MAPAGRCLRRLSPAGYLWCAVLLSLGTGMIAGRLEDLALRQSRWSYPVLIPFLALLLWAAATLLWSTAYQRVLALLSLVLAGLAAVLPALAITAARGEQVARLMTWTAGAAVVATAVNGLVYGPPKGRRLSVPLGRRPRCTSR